ncbi:MAG: SDR family NAD(P)-dependent oxidoreductase [Saprospiraceae bacterium]|uniref:SDR family NAD(P)-dependent oxidoreductase n=1 Tax=Candidatus Opimibacter skivensis TaxID=2982028 RepID=A0A9D7SPS2_9BACT|nr:SDR family NAD(P)-dependent oxidoreductase [Candidatus Opimibacter skivensis]
MKNVIVTGANSGLGLWTTKYLLDLDYSVVMACRNIEKTQKAIDEFPEFDKNKEFIIRKLDLADFESIRNFVDGLEDFETIYALDCNAGISYEGPFRFTKNGIEETFGTNYLGHFLLTNLLLEKYTLERIVMISSELHNPKNKSPFAKAVFKPVPELAYPKVDENTTLQKQTQSFYATSKLCDILFTYELDRRFKAKGLPIKTLVNAINPGLMLTTNLGRKHTSGENLYRKFLDIIFKIIGLSDNPRASAKSVVRLIDAITTSGLYYDKDKLAQSSADSYDEQKAKALWEGSEAIIGSKFLTK